MSSFADLERSIQNNANQVEKLIGLMGDLNTQSNKAKKTTADLTSYQKKLGIAIVENGNYYNKEKIRLNKYGQELNAVGDKTGNFNKRTSIMAQTVKKFTQDGKTTPFLKGLGVYLKQGGNSLEYFAEFLTSSREEMTVFGFEAAKVRKVVYGFFPPGMFKRFNQLSSTLQFVGGMWRKLGDNTVGASNEIKKYKEVLAGLDEGHEDIEALTNIIKELEGEADDSNWVTVILGGIKKISKAVANPIRPKVDMKDMFGEGSEKNPLMKSAQWNEELEAYLADSKGILKKTNISNFLMGNPMNSNSQIRKRLRRETKVVTRFLRKFNLSKQYKDNFQLLPKQKETLKELKSTLKKAKKFTVSNVPKVDLAQKQKDMGADAGLDDTKVVELKTAFSSLGDEIIKADEKVRKIQKSIDGGNVGAWDKKNKAQIELNELLDKETKIQRELVDEQTKYSNELNKIATLADAQTALIEENAQLVIKTEKEISETRTAGLQGYRKKLVELGTNYKEHNRQLSEGTDIFDESIEKNKKLIESIDVTKVEKEIVRLAETTEKRAEQELKLKQKLKDFEDGKKPFKNEGELKAVQDQLKAVQALEGKGEELAQQLVDRQKAVKELGKMELQKKGLNAIKSEIALTKQTIKVNKQKLAGAEKIIKASDKQIKQSEKAKKKLVKDFEAKRDAAESIPEQIKIMQELDVELSKEDDLITKAEADKKQAEGNMDIAITDIDEGQENLDNSTEQLSALKDIKTASTEKLLKKFPILSKVFKFVNAFKKLLPALGQGLRMFMMGFIYVSLAILGLLIVIKTFGPIIKEVWGNILKWLQPAFTIISAAFAMIWDGVKMVFSAFFGEGTFADAVDGLLKIAFGLLGVLLGLALASLTLGFALLIEVGKVLWQKGVDYFLDMFTSVKKFTKGIVLIVAIVGTIVAMILGAPVWLALVIGVILWRVGSKLVDPVTKVIKFIKKKVIAIIDAVKSINPFAEGGVTTKGLSLVGEKGPELVNLPKGTRVHSNRDSRNMIANSGQRGGTINNINITVNAKDTSKAEMDRIAREISRSITNNISRQSNTNNMR